MSYELAHQLDELAEVYPEGADPTGCNRAMLRAAATRMHWLQGRLGHALHMARDAGDLARQALDQCCDLARGEES